MRVGSGSWRLSGGGEIRDRALDLEGHGVAPPERRPPALHKLDRVKDTGPVKSDRDIGHGLLRQRVSTECQAVVDGPARLSHGRGPPLSRFERAAGKHSTITQTVGNQTRHTPP